MRELEQLNFLKLMLAEDAAGVFAGGSRFGAETSGPSGDLNGQFFFRNGLVPVEVVEFDLGRGSKPEVRAFQSKKIGGKLDRKSTRLNSSHDQISYAVFCLKKKK